MKKNEGDNHLNKGEKNVVILSLLLMMIISCKDSNDSEYTKPVKQKNVQEVRKKENIPMIPMSEGFEAREWLKQQPDKTDNNHVILNRFKDKKEALEFVEKLYSAGAEKVFVPYEIDENNKKTPQNAVAVKCPTSDKAKGQIVYDICLSEEPRAEVLPLVSVKDDFTAYIDWDN